MVRELRETRDSLMKSVDLLSKQLSDSSNEKAALLQKIDDLMSMISVNNKVRFGSTSQKGTKKKAAPVQSGRVLWISSLIILQIQTTTTYYEDN